MSISLLRPVLPPPNSPTEVPVTRVWDHIEAEVGPLPRDYKDFVEEYGTGVIDDFIMVFTPFASNRHLNLGVQAQRSAAALREGAGAEPDALFDVERVRVFGRTDNGDFLAWEVEGPPDEWNVIVIGSRGPFLDHFEGGMAAFLAEALQGNLTSHVLPDDFPSERPSFTPVG